MTTLTTPLTELPEEFRPLRVEEYHALIETGVFDRTHVELIGGVLVEMSPQGPGHFGYIPFFTHLLVRLAGDDFIVSPQSPVIAGEYSEPEPDFAILTARDTRVSGKPTDPVLVIEVSHSSLRFDLGLKATVYAEAGYPEYWVVDVQGQSVHVHRAADPAGTWGSVSVMKTGTLQAVEAPVIRVDVGSIFDC